MKLSNLILVTSLLLPLTSFAEVLLRCNTPTGSGVAEITVYTEDGKYFVKELNAFGRIETPVRISKASWIKQDLKWKSREGGTIHMHVPKDGSNTWAFDSVDFGWTVHGYCQ